MEFQQPRREGREAFIGPRDVRRVSTVSEWGRHLLECLT